MLLDIMDDVNIGSGCGLVPPGNKSSPEPMLTKTYGTISLGHQASQVVFSRIIFIVIFKSFMDAKEVNCAAKLIAINTRS